MSVYGYGYGFDYDAWPEPTLVVKCEYCASAVECPGRCDSCGAPAKVAKVSPYRMEVTSHGDSKRRFVNGLP